MATGRYTRIDGRKSSGYCSTVTIVLVVSACLIGAWMMMSSSVEPEGNVVLAAQQKKGGEKPQKVVDNPSSSREFEDNSGDLPEDTGKGNVDQDNVKDESNNDVQENESATQKESENSGESSQEEKIEKPNSDENEKNESEERKEVEAEKDENEQKNTGEGDTNGNDQEGSGESTDENKNKTDESEGKSGGEESSEDVKQEGEQESKAEKETEQDLEEKSAEKQKSYSWKLCNVTAGPDYIPCLDNIAAIRKLPSRSHYEHRERHCPEEAPTCLVPLPEGYKISVKWPKSRDKIWFANVPHMKLAEYKGHQNWVKASGEYLTFPGGGTQFIHGVTRYIDLVQQTVPDIAWGKRTRVVLDVGCGVASFGGYLFDKDVVTMSLAPKDEHEAQVQFALERGIPAILAVMGSKRLPFPGMAFDVVHCARCRVPWHNEGGKLLLELNRLLRPGGYFVWSATPVYRNDPENAGIWKEMTKLTKAMCWDLVKIGKDPVNEVSVAIYRKPMSNDCYEGRPENDPPLCQESDNRDAAWGIHLQACIHKVPTDPSERGSQWPAQWPSRVQTPPYWLKDSEVGVHGKPASKDFTDDYKHWKKLVTNSYLDGIGIDWSSVRNVMDMRATYGGFAAALRDLKVWVMNVVPVHSLDTLPIIYERGLFGIYHDWCESFSTYPRTYDLLHADHLFSNLKKRCNFVAVMAEVDRILRPEGRLVVRDNVETINEVENMAKSLHWKVRFTFLKDNEGVLCVQKTRWRPSEVETILSAIGVI